MVDSPYSVYAYVAKNTSSEQFEKLFKDIPRGVLQQAGCRMAAISFHYAEQHGKKVDINDESYLEEIASVYQPLERVLTSAFEKEQMNKFLANQINAQELQNQQPRATIHASSIILGRLMEKLVNECIEQPCQIDHLNFMLTVEADVKSRNRDLDLNWLYR